jgi:hypothetical protein
VHADDADRTDLGVHEHHQQRDAEHHDGDAAAVSRAVNVIGLLLTTSLFIVSSQRAR